MSKLKFDWKSFGEDVLKKRKKMNLGLRECSHSMPISIATWCRAEQGRQVTAPVYIFLCEWMRRNPLTYAISAPRPRGSGSGKPSALKTW